MRLLAPVFFISLFASLSNAIVINEIMYNPAGDDNNNEWVELYNNDSISYNMSGWTIGDMNSNDSLQRLQGNDILPAGGYALIGEEGVNLSLYPNAIFFSAGAAIGNGLGNTNDAVFLFSDSLLDNISYSSSQGGNENGKTLCRLLGGITECQPTPAASNIASNQDVKLGILLPGVVVVSQNYTSLFKIEIDNKNCAAMDNISVSYNITNATSVIKQGSFTKGVGCTATSDTGDWVPDKEGGFALCGIISQTTSGDALASNNVACRNVTVMASAACSLNIWLEANSVVNAASTMNYKILVNDTGCSNSSHSLSVSYWIEDLFGKIVRNETTDQSMTCFISIDRQWTPGGIEGSEAFTINADITNPYCTDTDSSNNFNTKLIAVRGLTGEVEKESYIKINGVDVGSDNVAQYGETVDVTAEVYRNSTAKYAVNVWIKNSNGTGISGVSAIHANKKLATYVLKIPIQLKPNCDSAFADGVHTIVFEGLDTNANAAVNISGISGSTCKTAAVSGGSGSVSGGGSSAGGSNTISLPYEAVSYPDRVYAGQKFFVKLKLMNVWGAEKNLSVYSYVYRNNTPVSIGFGNGRWSGSWDANKRDIKLLPNESVIVNLESQIENATEPGKYILNARVQADKDYDFKRDLDVVSRPHLMVTKDGKSISLETDCTGCSILVLPEDIVFNTTSASMEASAGRHSIMLLTGDAILEKVSVDVDDRENRTERAGTDNIVTGSSTKADFIFDIVAVAKAFVLVFIQKFA